jgi:hypothetical protein
MIRVITLRFLLNMRHRFHFDANTEHQTPREKFPLKGRHSQMTSGLYAKRDHPSIFINSLPT